MLKITDERARRLRRAALIIVLLQYLMTIAIILPSKFLVAPGNTVAHATFNRLIVAIIGMAVVEFTALVVVIYILRDRKQRIWPDTE